MSDEAVAAIARIPLARSVGRILAAPTALLLVGLVTVALALLLLTDLPRVAATAGGVAIGLAAIVHAARALSVRLEVEVSTLRVRRLGGDLRFTLVRGAVTRVPLTGEGAARLRPWLGPFAWGAGRATLRGEETIHVVRLAPTRSLILVPTDGGRIGIAPASEEQLLAALTAAARVQQRLDQVAARAKSLPIDRLVEPPPPRPAPPPAPDPGRVLTGIERVQLEQRLAAERAAAIAAAEEERRRAVEAAAAAKAAMEAEQRAAAATAGTEGQARPRRPVLARVAVPRPRLRRPRLSLPAAGRLPQEVAAGYLVAVVPLLLATVVWAYASVSGHLDLPEGEARLVGLTLALVGPAAALGALVARAWFPRLLGVVAVTSICALVLAGRALLA
jgi:hypothetical protein